MKKTNKAKLTMIMARNVLNRNKFISDTVHPNIPGYDRIAYVYIDNFNKHKNYLCN